jgi:hypothetical protein
MRLGDRGDDAGEHRPSIFRFFAGQNGKPPVARLRAAGGSRAFLVDGRYRRSGASPALEGALRGDRGRAGGRLVTTVPGRPNSAWGVTAMTTCTTPYSRPRWPGCRHRSRTPARARSPSPRRAGRSKRPPQVGHASAPDPSPGGWPAPWSSGPGMRFVAPIRSTNRSSVTRRCGGPVRHGHKEIYFNAA